MKTRDLRVALAALCGLAVLASTAVASTGIRLTAKDGAIIGARTMEAGTDLQSNMLIIPRNWTFAGTGPNKTPGLQWTTKYGFVGPNVQGQTWVCDGLNEKGLAIGNFVFPENTGYQTIDKQNANRALASYQVATYLLGTCATVQDAIAALQNVRVCKGGAQPNNFTGTWHYAVYDAQGHSAVIDYTNGKLNVHENTQGIVTTSPTFHQNLNNLRSYLQTASNTEAGQQCVWQAFHLLNQFDVPVGTVLANNQGQSVGEYTNWTTAADMTHLRYYFHTYQNRQVKMVDLNKMDLNAKDVKTISMHQGEVINDVSGTVD